MKPNTETSTDSHGNATHSRKSLLLSALLLINVHSQFEANDILRRRHLPCCFRFVLDCVEWQ
ncbi:MAG: hypothetical protein HXK55_05075 [Bacteroidetes bacterium]|nr:hypothetical protein [Bacteroidota bacterium]